MNKPIAVGVGLLVLVLLLLFSTTYTVNYNEVAVKATFGETDESSIVREPGLHYRLPVFIDKVTKLDTRLQLVESPMEEITTSDGLQIVVRAFLLWRVDLDAPTGPLDFFKSHMSIDGGSRALDGQFRTVLTGQLSRFAFDDLVGADSRLTSAEEDIRAAMASAVAGEGIEPVAVGINRVMLPPKTTSAVLSRMLATRDVLAEGERNTGTSEAERIRTQGNTWADKIRAFANQRAEEIRARGEREAAKYLEQMGEDPELAIFLVQLDTLERTLSRNATIVLHADEVAPFHLANPRTIAASEGIPEPGNGTGRAETPPVVPGGTPAASPTATVADREP